MTKKKELVRNQDQFLVRLPEGMRERIKAKADRAGMSMNEAIVYCLEQFFPAPKTMEERLNDLAQMVSILKGDNTYQGVEKLVDEVQKTIEDIYFQDIKTAPNFEKAVSDRYEQWEEWEAERVNDEAYNPFDDDNYPDIGGTPFEEVDRDAPVDPENPMAVYRKKEKDG